MAGCRFQFSERLADVGEAAVRSEIISTRYVWSAERLADVGEAAARPAGTTGTAS